MFIGGEDRPIKFGINQTDLYCTLRGISITVMQEEMKKFVNGDYTGGEIRDLIWSALADGARKEKIDFPFTNLDVGDWLEEVQEGELTKALNEMNAGAPKVRANSAKKKVRVSST